MSTEIVSEICPPPEWNLTAEDIQHMAVELEGFYQIFKPGFERRDQAAHGWVYLQGLLSDLPRKVTERIALRFGTCVRSLQHFIGQSPWEREWLLEKQQALVVATLGETDGVVLVDKSGMPKQGDHSVGVARQYCGSLGKVANAQVGVYLGYASRKGHSFLDGRLFLPKQWFAAEYQDLRQACGVPPEQRFQTKPEIGLELLQNTLQQRGFAVPMGGGRRVVRRRARFSRRHRCLGQMVFRGSTLHNRRLAGTARGLDTSLERSGPPPYPAAPEKPAAAPASCTGSGSATACQNLDPSLYQGRHQRTARL